MSAAAPKLTVLGLPLRTVLLLLHVAALAVGMGGALLLDGYLMGYLYREAVTEHVAELARLGGNAITWALAVLWLSGLGFMAQYALETPERLANPKLWAKITVVAILTANGYLIHRVVFARVRACIGQPLLAGLSLGTAQPLLMLGAISSMSWLTAFALGMVRELNDVVPAPTILTAYVALLLAANLLAAAMHQHFVRALPMRGVVGRPSFATRRASEPASTGSRFVPPQRFAAVLQRKSAVA